MKVLFLNPLGTLGGAERALLDLFASIRGTNEGIEVSLLSLEDGPLLAEARMLGAAAEYFPVPRSLTRIGDSGGIDIQGLLRAGAELPYSLLRLSRRLRQIGPDIVHSNGFKAHVLAAITPALEGALVWHFHDFVSQRPVMQRLLPLLRRRAQMGIAVSEAVADDARVALPGMPVRTILNAVRTADFDPRRVQPADLDRLAGLSPAPPGTLRVGLVSTFAWWKGHDIFLEAARRFNDPRLRFFVVGGPVYSTRGSQRTNDELKESISALGLATRCGLVPFQRDPAPVFAALDVLVHASSKPEPFGRTVAEGMSAGRAVVAANGGGVREQIVDGVSGLLFPLGNVDALVEQLRRVLASEALRQSLGRAARERACTLLDYQRLGPETISAYRSLRPKKVRREGSSM
jgi:glycosyltransferase involved in cell wall biosynthesis